MWTKEWSDATLMCKSNHLEGLFGWCLNYLQVVHNLKFVLKNVIFTTFLQHFHVQKILSYRLLLMGKKVI